MLPAEVSWNNEGGSYLEEIVLVRGDTLKLCIESIKTSDGGEYTLSDSDVIYIDIKKVGNDDTAVLSKMLTYADYSETGPAIMLYPRDTADIPFGNYVFDIRLVMDEDNIYTIVPETKLRIIRNITEIPKG